MQVRTESIEGKKIYIIDEVLSGAEIDGFFAYAETLPFYKVEKSTSYDEFPIFSTDFDPTRFEEDSFIGQKARDLIQEFIQTADQYRLKRAYINLSSYGDVEYPHYDCALERSDLTVLYYVNRQWHYKYGGETIFYQNKDSRIAILPQPGRFVIFPGNIEHMGTIATRICKINRMSLALKYVSKTTVSEQEA